jgi:hypothetical protein
VAAHHRVPLRLRAALGRRPAGRTSTTREAVAVTAKRCDVTELMADQCAHCRGLDLLPDGPDPRYERDGFIGPTITARYDSVCGGCGCDIRTGEPITRIDDGWVCRHCHEVNDGS